MKITLIHTPAFYDFRKMKKYYGPISDVIPSTPIFDMYPLGFVSLVSYLEKLGHKVEILNLAALMLLNNKFNVEKRLQKLKSDVFAIDLHWLVHAQGSLKIAELLKKYHPEIPIVFGGLSSTYFYRELIKYPYVDFILRGDTTEEPFAMLLNALDDRISFSEVPNLVWKKDGHEITNKLSYVPNTIPRIDYEFVANRAFKSFKWKEWLPYASFLNAPITAIFTVKGCTFNCITCGGSRFSFERFFNRSHLSIKSPKDISAEVSIISEYTKVTIFFVGDLRQTGIANQILSAIKETKTDNPLIFEFFTPPSLDFLKRIRDVSDGPIYLQISPESHDDSVRNAFGRPYTTESLLKFLRNAQNLGFERTDLYFMVGLPHQTYDSAIKTAEFAGKLASEKIATFIAPLAPFVDPGSIVFENPSKFGYTLLFKTLDEHRKAFYSDKWYEFLNYETKWMTRRTIEAATIGAMKKITEMKYSKGLVSKEVYEHVLSALSTTDNKTEVEHMVHSREELYPTSRLLKLFRIKPKTVYFLVKLLFGFL